LSRKLTILLLVASAAINSVMITYVVEERFKSSAQVLIRPRNEVKIRSAADSKEVLNFPLPAVIPFEVLAQTYSEVIKSRAVVEQVVRTLGMHKKEPERVWWKRLRTWVKDTAYDTWTLLKYGRLETTDPFEETVAEVQKRISVTPIKDSYVFEIGFDAKDPSVAAAVVNTATTTFLEFTGRLFQTEAESTRKVMEDQLRESANQLEISRVALRTFKDANQIVMLDREVSAKITSLADFEDTLETTGKEIEATKAEIREISAQLAPIPMYVKSSATVEDNPLVTELRSTLAKYEIELSGLAKELAPGHPKVVALEASIAETRQKLAKEEAKIISAETSSMSNVHRVLSEDLVKARAKLEGLLAQERDLRRIVERQKSELKRVPAKEFRLNQLELEVRSGEDTRKQIAQAYEEARIREAGVADDLKVISAAVPATYPSRPIKIYYAGLSVAMALVIGLAFALAAEVLRPTIRSIEDVEQGLDLPVLTTIPVHDGNGDAVARRKPAPMFHGAT
jgi:uncharacterized protein involved in exopolysaccharide biosynthesis